jgi:Rrf2 family protein
MPSLTTTLPQIYTMSIDIVVIALDLIHNILPLTILQCRLFCCRLCPALMKLSLRGEYALRALLVLGLHYQEVIRIQVISEEQNIPKRFLEQILNDLKSAGFVESRRGMSGGYRLARKPDEITLASVIRHVEGALAPISCVSERFYEKCSCPDETRCAIRSVMKEVREAIVKVVERVSIADLCDRSRKLQQSSVLPLDFVI